jgi:transketolase
MNSNQVGVLCQKVQRAILESTTEAGSGHPTSSLSAAQFMTVLFADGYFRQNTDKPHDTANDRLVFSKGHAAPLLYSLYYAFGQLSKDELMSLRKKGSVIKGHPTPQWKFVDVATGSLGQGLSIGLGMALGIKQRMKNDELRITNPADEPRVFVLLGDSEVAEGQVWEAAELAGKYNVDNLVAILDVNRLGQRGETMLGWDVETYKKRFEAFGWHAVIVEQGNDILAIQDTLKHELTTINHQPSTKKPIIFILKTQKGFGVSFLANKDGWHGKAVPKEQLNGALAEIGEVDENLVGAIAKPTATHTPKPSTINHQLSTTNYQPGATVATREAYGEALVSVGRQNPNLIVFDAETSNSTFADAYKKAYPDRFFEMYIAEQNMVSVALGFSKLGFEVFASTFAAFFARAFDQIRMLQYSDANVNFCGSHAGVSIGADGSSQMALEDLAMMRSVLTSTVFYPSDAPSTHALVKIMNDCPGIFYLRTTREKTPIIYSPDETFEIGGSKIHQNNAENKAVIYAAGITLHEALKAQNALKNEQIDVAVVDLYSVKPVDTKTILSFGSLPVIVVEDHYPIGGLGDAIAAVLTEKQLSVVEFRHLCVQQIPHSATPAELLAEHGIDAAAIVRAVKDMLAD